jgi:hypothetical protein
VALYADPPDDDGAGRDEHHDAHREPSLIQGHAAPCPLWPAAWLIL